MSTGIIIQARRGSKRLPDKMTMPFYKGKNILEIVLERLKNQLSEFPIILATTVASQDLVLQRIAEKYDLECYRGPEEDVLERFLQIGEQKNFDFMVRVCADNPFLYAESVKTVIQENTKAPADYLSFSLYDGTPSIKSHLGLFTEIVSLKALKKVKHLTSEPIYHEHVTNYIYEHPQKFKVNFLKAPDILYPRKDIRLTIDTAADFELSAHIFAELMAESIDVDLELLVNYLDQNPGLLKRMRKQIDTNAK